MMDQPEIIKDIWDAILDDKWMWCVVWGPPRTGKTTVQLRCAYAVYKDWDKVLDSIAFTLPGILYKMDSPSSCRIMTRNKLHDRVPMLILDDFGANANKAKTQHETAWDIFKGAFDTFATKVAVLMASMANPTEPTIQLNEKFTHEIFVPERGVAKYDHVNWEQNFGGWRCRQRKGWVQTFEVEEIPMDVYKQYDEMRLSLVDEMTLQINDTMANDQAYKTMKRLEPEDVELLSMIQHRGGVTKTYLRESLENKFHEALVRCKARSLVVPLKKGDYWYDITDFGIEVLKTYRHSQDGKSNENCESPNVLH